MLAAGARAGRAAICSAASRRRAECSRGSSSASAIAARLRGRGRGRAERGENAGLAALAVAFLACGATELVSGCGLLAVFVAARIELRLAARDRGPGECDRPPHAASARFATVLPAPLLPWFGGALVMGTLAGLPPAEVALALAVVFVVRPSAGRPSLPGHRLRLVERAAIAFLGIRGPGGVFSVACG